MAMEKINSLGLTKRKLLFQGSILILLGACLIYTGTWLPELAIRLSVIVLFVSSLLDLIMRLLKRGRSSGGIVFIIGRCILFFCLIQLHVTTAIPIYLMGFTLGIYQLMMACVAGITYGIYYKEKIRPRWRLLLDTIWLGGLGVWTLLSSTGNAYLQAMLVGGYLVFYGLSNLRDGFLFSRDLVNSPLKRHIRISLPLIVAALIPRETLKRINGFLVDNSEEVVEEMYDTAKESQTNASLEVFVHVLPNGFGSMGHIDFSYKGRVYSYGNYDLNSLHLKGTLGDGVLFTLDHDSYIDFCTKFGKTLLGYKLVLTPEQEAGIEKELDALMALTVPWEPTDEVVDKDINGNPVKPYIYRLRHDYDAEVYKFTQSRFKTYFVMSTNCVALADYVIGKAGTDIVSVKGFISPGTYQNYLDREFERPNSMVVAKDIYLPEKA